MFQMVLHCDNLADLLMVFAIIGDYSNFMTG